MKKFTNINEANSKKYMNKSQLYLLSIPYAMYKEYGQYKLLPKYDKTIN